MRDVGPGLDGVSAASLNQLNDDAKLVILHHLNIIFRTGVIPSSWNEIRIVLHYKGKGSDPYCADNYRGLGIGAIWEKVLSLMMMNRLEEYLHRTDSLHGSQGGFLRMRGPPEQVFTLSETVRAELCRQNSKQPVFLTFIDIERAYDSVIHQKLWVRCAELGIGGRFLAILQAMYASKKGTIDVNGELIGSHEIECGVLQGNPLSPLLFNIYIDGLLRKIDEFARADASIGVPLPFVSANRANQAPTHLLPLSLNVDLAARLCSLFFADDGVLITRNHASTQRLIDFVEAELRRIGLPMNARKTKILIVPPLTSSVSQYGELKKQSEKDGGFIARGRPVEVVDEFLYLGVTLWWRWDFSKALQSALGRAKRGLYRLRQAGFQNRGIPLVFQYRLASAHVLSHLDYVAPLVGVEGYSLAIAANERILSNMLRVIAGTHPKSSGDALKAESGTWQQAARIRMLQLRFFSKLCCAPIRSTHFRALALSQRVHNLNAGETIFRKTSTPFISRVISAARLFVPDSGVPNAGEHDFATACHILSPSTSLVVLERLEAAVWARIRPDLHLPADLPNQQLRLRCTSARAFSVNYTTMSKEVEWDLPCGTPIADALRVWSLPLRLACFASLRRRGNGYRHQLFLSTAAEWSKDSSALRDYAPLKRSSYMEPYWFNICPRSAQRLLRARTAQRWGNEFDLRRADCIVLLLLKTVRSDAYSERTTRRGHLPRIPPEARACYLCPLESWMPETISHLYLNCQHAGMVSLRLRSAADLSLFAERVSRSVPSAPPSPNFSDDIILYSVLQLCTGIGQCHHRQPAANNAYQLDVLRPMRMTTRGMAAAQQQSMSERRINHVFHINPERMRAAVVWVSFLSSAWRSSIGNDRANSSAAEAGRELVAMVCRFNQSLFSLRRRLLSSASISSHYLTRDRDPPLSSSSLPLLSLSPPLTSSPSLSSSSSSSSLVPSTSSSP